MAKVLQLDVTPAEPLLDAARAVAAAGGILAVPTESFYALAAPAEHGDAVRRVLAIKQRPETKPLLVLIGTRDHLARLVAGTSPAAQLLMRRFWPGPLTLIFSAAAHLSAGLTAGTGSIGVREPGLPALRALLRAVGPLTGTSANRSGYPPLTTAAEVERLFGTDVDLIVDGGPTAGGLPSTIVDTRDPVCLVREGPISRHQLDETLTAAGQPPLK